MGVTIEDADSELKCDDTYHLVVAILHWSRDHFALDTLKRNLYLVSVIIPTHNRSELVERAISSVQQQTYRDLELIVVDDGSTDGTAEKIRKYDGIKLIETEHRGVSHARNQGAQAASGEWLAFLDSDDEWLPGKLAAQMQLTNQFECIHTEETWIRDGKTVAVNRRYRKQSGRIFSQAVDVCCISPSSVLLRKDLFFGLNGFREDFPVCEDYELWLKLTAIHEIGLVAQPMIRKYGGHPDQLSTRYKAMDYYRAKALTAHLENPQLKSSERELVAQTLLCKCEILERGYLKYQNLNQLPEVKLWADWARKALTANHNDHSVAERRPRSDCNFSL